MGHRCISVTNHNHCMIKHGQAFREMHCEQACERVKSLIVVTIAMLSL